MITPAISVLSAVEGLTLVSPALHKFVLPTAVIILIGIFAVQSHGTAAVAKFFGPSWRSGFSAWASAASSHIFDNPSVLAAISPHYGLSFLFSNGLVGLTVLGLVFLCVTGAEALTPTLATSAAGLSSSRGSRWVLPALMLNYFGQAALVLSDHTALDNPSTSSIRNGP